MGAVTWVAPTAVSSSTLSIDTVTVNDGAGDLSAEYDNQTNLFRWATVKLTTTHATDPSAGAWYVYLIPASDGTNYDTEAGDSTQPTSHAPMAVFALSSSTSAQRHTSDPFMIPPLKFKLLAWNDTGVNSSTDLVSLEMEVWNETVA